MYLQYEDAELEKLKRAELIVYSDFKRVCEKYNIKFFGLYGTAIGVFRHKGFIPWDDDIDLGIMRKDFNRFLEIFDKEMGEKYEIKTPVYDKKYASTVVKVQRKGTVFIPEFSTQMKTNLGIHIDLFIYDKLDEKKPARQVRITRLYTMLLFLSGSSKPILPNNIVGKLLKIVCVAIHYLMRLFHISNLFLYSKYEKSATRNNEQNFEKYTTFESTEPLTSIIDKRQFMDIVEYPFEYTTMPLVKDYDKILEGKYGNYMKLPPEEERVNHVPIKIEYGDIFEGGEE